MFLSVVLGAFGAHGLQKFADPKAIQTFKTGVTYQFYHSIGLFMLAVLHQLTGLQLKWPVRCFSLGLILFCGFCYLYALTKIKVFAMIVPIGGLSFLIGWLVTSYQLIKTK